MNTAPPPVEPSPRWRAIGCLVATVVLGLSSRRYPLPGFLAEYTGDALYTAAVFFGLRTLATTTAASRLAVAAFVVSAAVEASQLLRWQWLVDVRGTTLGALLLGQGFQWADLLAYAAGAALAFAVDAVARRRG